MVDAQPAEAAQALRDAIRAVSPKAIHTIIDTHLLSDRPGGDDALIKLRGAGASQQVRVAAHEAVLDRLVNGPGTGTKPVGGLVLNQVISLPINNTYTSPGRDFYLNGESIFLYHAPAAHTDGDTIVTFAARTSWPWVASSSPIGIGHRHRPWGSVNGLIAALNRILGDRTRPFPGGWHLRGPGEAA